MNAERKPKSKPWVGPMLLATVFVALVAWSWKKWPDVLVDFGRELYIPWQLASGQTLYSDIAYFNGPLSPWINSVLFEIFGVGMMTLVTANLVVLTLVAGTIYFLVREISRPWVATVGSLVFLTVFAFGQYVPYGNFNFVTPYSHEMTHGMALSLAALLLLAVHLRRGGLASLLACGLVAGLVFLTKAELFLALFVALIGGFASYQRVRRTPLPVVARLAASFIVGLLLPPLFAFIVLARHLPPALAFQGTLGSWAYVFRGELGSTRFYQDILGLTDLGESLLITGAWCLRYATVLVPAFLAGWFLPRSKRNSGLVAATLFAFGVIGVLHRLREAPWDGVAQPFPLAMLAVVGVLLALQWRSATQAEARRFALMLAFALFATALLAKIILQVRVLHYGFALALPAAVVLAVALVEGIPRLLDRRGKNGTAFRFAALGIVTGFIVVHLIAANSWLRLHTVEVGQGRDAFLADSRGQVMRDLLVRLEQLTTAGQTLAVLPEGVMVNYLARMTNPTPYVNFMPPELIMFGEKKIVAAFESDPPDWIVLTDRHAPEYGYDLLGTDYGLKITDWLQPRYELAAEVVDKKAARNQLRYAYVLRRIGERVP